MRSSLVALKGDLHLPVGAILIEADGTGVLAHLAHLAHQARSLGRACLRIGTCANLPLPRVWMARPGQHRPPAFSASKTFDGLEPGGTVAYASRRPCEFDGSIEAVRVEKTGN